MVAISIPYDPKINIKKKLHNNLHGARIMRKTALFTKANAQRLTQRNMLITSWSTSDTHDGYYLANVRFNTLLTLAS